MVSILIPTTYKSKLPKVLSWPVGAEELSAALADVTTVSRMEVTFYCRGARAVEAARTTSWMELLSFRYFRRAGHLTISQQSVENGVLEPHWHIRISPVLRELRKRLHDGILQQMPQVSARLRERASLNVIGESRISLIWDAAKDDVYVSLVDHLEPKRV